MAVTGIICEYNPLHLGHSRQIRWVKDRDSDGCLVCLMSGNYVQRGEPAIFDRTIRAEAALRAGADLVLELPVNISLSSAEGFAQGSIQILNALGADALCFGAECGDPLELQKTARILLTSEFSQALREHLDRGLSFPAARSQAAQSLGANPDLLSKPNNILATEYLKAIYTLNCKIEPLVLCRDSDYHSLTILNKESPSATSLRNRLLSGEPYLEFVPECCRDLFTSAELHSLKIGERAILGKLRSMDDREFELLPYGSEGLWRKLMHESRRQDSLDQILNAVKSKRYTRTRLNRMVLCAFLGLNVKDLEEQAPYVRILAVNGRGRNLLRELNTGCPFVNLGKTILSPWQTLEDRCTRLYGLFGTRCICGTSRQRITVMP